MNFVLDYSRKENIIGFILKVGYAVVADYKEARSENGCA